jgi:hypothetical protein
MLQFCSGIELLCQFPIGKQDVNLFMAGTADINCGSRSLPPTLSRLAGNQVMDGEGFHPAIAKFTNVYSTGSDDFKFTHNIHLYLQA